MPTQRRSRPKRRLVLDIGSSAVRLCELARTKTGYQLVKYYQREFPVEPSMDEEEQNGIRLETLRALLKESKVRSRKAVFGVPGQSVFVRPRTLPPVPEHKVSQIVRYEIQQQIPFSLDQIAFDYQVLQRTEAGGYDVLMAAIKADVVDKQVEIIQQAKRGIDTVDVCPFAAYNWLKNTGEFGEEGECVALLDLGAVTTDIVIEREGQFRFQRSLNIGGNDITAAVSTEFGVPWQEAEKLKRERGFAPTGDPRRDGKGGEVIGRALSRLVSEVNRSFAYFRSQPGGGAVSRIIVTGGGACLRNVIPYLQKQLGLEVRIAQPLAGLAISPAAQEVNDHPEQAAAVLGLALRCWEPVPVAINLTPPRILQAARRRQQLLGWGGCVAVFAVIMASMIPAWVRKNEIDIQNTEKVKRVIASYDSKLVNFPGLPSQWPESRYIRDLTDAQDDLDRDRMRIHLLDKAREGRRQHDWIKYMVLLNDLRPKGKLVVMSSYESIRMVPRIAGYAAVRGSYGDDDDDDDDDDDMGGPWGDDDDDDDDDGSMGFRPAAGGALQQRLAALRSGGVAPGASAVPIDPNAENLGFEVTAFPGISGGMSSVTRGSGSRSRGDDDDDDDDDDGGGFGMRAGSGRSMAGTAGPATEYNAIRIQGFAENAEVLREFVTALEDSGEFVEKGVVFNSAYSKRVPISSLDAAISVGASTGSRRGGSGGRGWGRTSGLGSSRRTGYQLSSVLPTMAGSSVMTFQIDLQVQEVAPDLILQSSRRSAGGRGHGGRKRSSRAGRR